MGAEHKPEVKHGWIQLFNPWMKMNLFLCWIYFLTALGEQFFTCSPLAACIFRYNMLDQLTTQNFLLNTMLHNTEDLAEETPD